jgi:hypothetical protein
MTASGWGLGFRVRSRTMTASGWGLGFRVRSRTMTASGWGLGFRVRFRTMTASGWGLGFRVRSRTMTPSAGDLDSRHKENPTKPNDAHPNGSTPSLTWFGCAYSTDSVLSLLCDAVEAVDSEIGVATHPQFDASSASSGYTIRGCRLRNEHGDVRLTVQGTCSVYTVFIELHAGFDRAPNDAPCTYL